ncbi:MAG: nucleoside recognition domain-containing protein, partial [Pseudomonadales bacterium]|nr:nucleoside recognition domain-containing protein [Pseudomonadales bacterium]
EAVVGTLDALYSEKDPQEPVGLIDSTSEAFMSIATNAQDLLGNLTDPLGISVGDISDPSSVAAEQDIEKGTLTNMALLFGSAFAAFCYLVFVLLYAPCVAVMGAIAKEAGWRWMVLVFSWTTSLAYVTSSCIYQIGTFFEHPVFTIFWVFGCCVAMSFFIYKLKQIGRRSLADNLIPAVQLG